MPREFNDKRENIYQWPIGGRFRAVADWIAAGYDVAGGYWSLVLRQKQLTPESLAGVSGYKDFVRRPDIHPLVWVKPDAFDGLEDAEGVFDEWLGPSGGGKDTIKDRARLKAPRLYAPVITHTTRPPRPEEVDGLVYNFTTPDDFDRLIREHAFAECVHQGDYSYGTTFQAIERAFQTNRIALWRGEPIGGEHLKYQIARRYGGRVACRQMFTVPTTSLHTLYRWIEDKRGKQEARSWRQQRAFLDIIAGGTMDIFIENPLQEDGPVQATEAFIATLQYMRAYLEKSKEG